MNSIDIDTSAFDDLYSYHYARGVTHGFLYGLVSGLAIVAIGWALCGCETQVGDESLTHQANSQSDSAAPDAAPATPAWCTPLTQANRACGVDPLVSFEEFFGYQPATVYACNGPASSEPTAECQGFVTGQCGVMVWGCGRLP